MRFGRGCLWVCWCLLLLVLTCRSQEHAFHEERSPIRRTIGETFKGFQEKIGNTFGGWLNEIFQPPATPVTSTTTAAPVEGEAVGKPKEIVYAPLRCPPDHIIINGRCRMQVR